MNQIEKKIRKQLGTQWKELTPGLRIQAYLRGKPQVDLAIGKTYEFYDLASLTKVLFTGRAYMRMFAEKKTFRGLQTHRGEAQTLRQIKKSTLVQSILPWWSHSQTTLGELLTHSSGLVWWEPFYEKLRDLAENSGVRYQALAKLLREAPCGEAGQSVYSDAGFMLLGFVLEAYYHKDLLSIWNQDQDLWNLDNTLHFRPLLAPETARLNEKPRQQKYYAPTEQCPWRKKLLQGEVHDENAWALGGVATHAGLFGCIDDVSGYLLSLRKILRGEGRKKPPVPTPIVQSFLKRAVPKECGDWSLGWMLPTPGKSSSGQYFSPYSVGHTGFTGTSMWWDLKKDLTIVILSNRVLLGRDNKPFAQLRPLLHDLIVEALQEKL